MPNKKLPNRAIGLIIPAILTGLVCAIDPANSTNVMLASATGWKLLEAMVSNWFANTAIDIADTIIDSAENHFGKLGVQTHSQPSHLAKAFGRAFAKTFSDLAGSFRNSTDYQKLEYRVGKEKLDSALLTLEEIGVEAQAIFADRKVLADFVNQSESQPNNQEANHTENGVAQPANPQQVLKNAIKVHLRNSEPVVVDFILRRIDEKRVAQLLENFQKELQEPESGTSAWRAWVMQQNEQLLKTTRETNITVHETNTAIQRVEEKINTILQPRSMPTPNQIPVYLDRDLFVGRQQEIAQIKALLLKDKKLCAIWGMPGIGKSAVANQIAFELQKDFVDGVLWLEVSDDSTQTLDEKLLPLLEKLGRAYGLNFEQPTNVAALSDRVSDLLHHKQALLVLDNVQDAKLIKSLFPEQRACSVLITTANRKIIPQRELVVELKRLADEDGVTLLQKIMGNQQLLDSTSKALVALVEGHPLALHIFGRTLDLGEHLEPSEYENYLSTQTNLLKHLIAQEGIISASFELAYRQLTEPQQQLFVRLGLFRSGDFSVDAVASIFECDIVEVKMDMGKLAAYALLQAYSVEENGNNLAVPETLEVTVIENLRKRYRMPSLLVDFARLKGAGNYNMEIDAAVFANYYSDLSGHFTERGFVLLDKDWPNLQAAIEWGLSTRQPKLPLKLVKNLTLPYLGRLGFMDIRGYWSYALNVLERLCAALPAEEEPTEQAWLSMKAGVFAVRIGEIKKGKQYLEQSQQFAETLVGNEQTALCVAYAYGMLAQARESSDPSSANRELGKAIAVLTGFSSPISERERGWLFLRRATTLARKGEIDLARVGFEQAVEKLLHLEPSSTLAGCYINLANLAEIQNDLTGATEYLQKAKTIAEQLGDRQLLAGILQNQAGIAEEQARFVDAKNLYKAALEEFDGIADLRNKCSMLSNLGHLATLQLQSVAAKDYISQALAIANPRYADDHEIQLHLILNQARLATLDKQLNDAQHYLDPVSRHPGFDLPGFEEIRDEYQQLQSELNQQRTDSES